MAFDPSSAVAEFDAESAVPESSGFDAASAVPDEPVADASPAPAQPTERGAVSGVMAGLARGAGGIVADLGGFVAGPVRQLANRQTLGLSEAIGEGGIYEKIGQALRSAGESVSKDPTLQPSASVQKGGAFNPSNPKWWLERSSEFVPQLAAQLGLAAVTKSPAAFMTSGGAQMAGNAFNEAIDDYTKRGEMGEQAREKAALEAGIVGTVGAFIEKIPGAEFLTEGPIAKTLMKALRSRIASRGVAGFVAEGTEEMLQEVVTDLAAAGFREGAERFKGALERYAGSFFLGGGPGAGAGMLTKGKEAAPAVEEEAKALIAPPDLPTAQTESLEQAVEKEAERLANEEPSIPAETTEPSPPTPAPVETAPSEPAAPAPQEIAPEVPGETIASPEPVTTDATPVTPEVTEPAVEEPSPALEPEPSAVEPPTLPETATGTPRESPTGIRNAIVDEERVKRGMPERMAPLKRTFGKLWDQAMAAVDRDPDAGKKLVASIAENPRPLEDWESALLAHEQVTRQNAFDRSIEAVNTATDDVSRDQAYAQLEADRAAVQQVYDAGQTVGTKSGQSLAARKMLVNDDFSLARMESETRAVVNKGKPLTKQQAAEVKTLHDKIAALEKKIEESQAREQDVQIKEAFAELIRQQKNEAKAAVKEGKKVVDFMRSQREAAKARIIARRGRLNVTVDPLNVAGLVDEAIIGASYVTEGITKLSEWSAKMLADFGERIRPYLPDLFERSKQFHADNAKLFEKTPAAAKPKVPVIEKAKANAAAGKGLNPQIVFDLAREKVRAGMDGLDAVMMAVHSDLKALHPDIAVRDVRDAFSGYGKTTIPSREADAVALRELRRQGQLVSAIEDAQRKVAPMKSGPQRDAASQKVRELQKQLKESMRASGIETRSPETQLKSANAARATALRNQIADLDKQLRTGEKPPGKTPVAASEEVERLRAERDAMKEKLAEIEAEQNPKPSPEERQLAADKKAIQTRIKQIQERIKAGDYGPKPKKTPLMDKEKADLQFQYQKAKETYLRGLFEARLRNRSTAKKILGGATEVLNTARAVMTSFDLSAVLRQGGFIGLAHPVRAAKSVVPMLKAFASEKQAFRINQQIADRPNAPLYKQAKLFLSDQDSPSLTKMEEAYMGRLAQKIPLVAGSARAYSTFLNKLRADSFDAMTSSLTLSGKPTTEEAQAIANFINVATGRGSVGQFQQSANLLNTIFFAPRYVASRFQLLAGQPLYGGTARTRKLVAQEYARYLVGVGLVYALAMAAQDDDDEPVSLEPTSSDFLKVRFGNSRLDPMSGLLQVTTFASREIDAIRRFVTQSKEKKPKYGSGGAVLARFLRSKLSPAVGTVVDAVEGKDVTGQKVTPGEAAKNMVVPISFGDIGEAIEANGVAKGTALSLLSLLGMGVQTYEKKPNR